MNAKRVAAARWRKRAGERLVIDGGGEPGPTSAEVSERADTKRRHPAYKSRQHLLDEPAPDDPVPLALMPCPACGAPLRGHTLDACVAALRAAEQR